MGDTRFTTFVQTRKGRFANLRVYLLTTVAYMGSFLFGYDTGVMSSVLALPSFKDDFDIPKSGSFASQKAADISSNVVALLTAGCFFGAIAAPFLNERLGRRIALMIFSAIFSVGAIIQTSASRELYMIYAGRIVAGLGIGGMSAITPVYVSEMAPHHVRGRITGLFQEFLVLGSMTAYWVDYGVALHISKTESKQWRVPVALQLIPGGVMLVGLLFLRESPRWLMKKSRHDEAIASLAYVRAMNKEEVMMEIAEIRAAIEEEEAVTEGVTWKECFRKGVRERFAIGIAMMFWQQFSGTNSIGYYAPQIFQTVGISSNNTSIFATGIYGTVKVVTTGIFLLVGIERYGRRKSLMAGALWMSSMMFTIGAVLATNPPQTKSPVVSAASIGMVVCIYMFVIGYSASWGPIPWVYLGEIFPTRVRAYGVGSGATIQWLFNFVITKITPAAINAIGWRTFVMFGAFCLASGVFVFLAVKETKGLTLEQMDVLFGSVDADTRKRGVEACIAVEKVAYREMDREDHKMIQYIEIPAKR